MCGRFTPVTHDELEGIVREIERERAASRGQAGPQILGDAPVSLAGAAAVASGQPSAPQQQSLFGDEVPELQSQPRDAYPKSIVPVIVDGGARLQIADLIWGYSVGWSSSPVFNARAEKALGQQNNMWADSLRNRRCIVATHGFFEPHATEVRVSPKTGRTVKQQYRFTLPDEDPLFLAGVWQDDRFSVMTCEPNRWVQPVHNRMPVVLRANELTTWMGDDFAHLFNRSDVQLDSAAV